MANEEDPLTEEAATHEESPNEMPAAPEPEEAPARTEPVAEVDDTAETIAQEHEPAPDAAAEAPATEEAAVDLESASPVDVAGEPAAIADSAATDDAASVEVSAASAPPAGPPAAKAPAKRKRTAAAAPSEHAPRAHAAVDVIDFGSPKPPVRGRRKVRIGRVVSCKMAKTVVVAVETRIRHPLYGKILRRTERFKAHDEQAICGDGDTVEICETRPYSREKRWRVMRMVEKAK